MTYSIRAVTAQHEWDTTLAQLPNAHLLQSWQWGEFKSRYGWRASRWLWQHNGAPVAAAQVLTRRVGPLSMLYAPKGPILDWGNSDTTRAALADLKQLARRTRAILIKIDPDYLLGTGIPDAPDQLPASHPFDGWTPSPDQIQFKNTVWLDLRQSEDELLANMKQKTRYNIRLAERKGVTVEAPAASDAPLDLLYRLYAETSVRDGFVIRHAEYYRDAWGSFIWAGHAQPFIAKVDNAVIAAIIVFRYGERAIYMYGMSAAQHRDKMPNHLLQWSAIKWAKAHGYAIYDFWGAPNTFDDSDSLFGVWRFKDGFNGTVIRTIGALDYAPSPLLYRLYTRALPRLLDLMRRRGKAQTRHTLAAD